MWSSWRRNHRNTQSKYSSLTAEWSSKLPVFVHYQYFFHNPDSDDCSGPYCSSASMSLCSVTCGHSFKWVEKGICPFCSNKKYWSSIIIWPLKSLSALFQIFCPIQMSVSSAQDVNGKNKLYSDWVLLATSKSLANVSCELDREPVCGGLRVCTVISF